MRGRDVYALYDMLPRIQPILAHYSGVVGMICNIECLCVDYLLVDKMRIPDEDSRVQRFSKSAPGEDISG